MVPASVSHQAETSANSMDQAVHCAMRRWSKPLLGLDGPGFQAVILTAPGFQSIIAALFYLPLASAEEKKMPTPQPDLPDVPQSYIDRLQRMASAGQRVMIGLVGAPGSGKSTVASALQRTFADISQAVPMDGYHLANVELARLGRASRKGAPDTFDSAGYVDLLRRLRHQAADEIVYAPEFRREIEEPIAGAIPVFPETTLVITEGNYLLLNEGHWAKVPALLDEIWYVDVDDELRIARLTKRHEQFGRSPEDARAWVLNTDEPNARLIAANKARARLLFRWDAD